MAYIFNVDFDPSGSLECLEESINRPLRVITGSAGTMTPDEWRLAGRRPGEFDSLDDFHEHGGVTVVVWGALSPRSVRGYRDVEYSQEFFRDSEVSQTIRDCVDIPESLFHEVELYGTKIGELDEQLLTLWCAPHNGFNWFALEPALQLAISDEFFADAEERRTLRNLELFMTSVQRRDSTLVRDLRGEISSNQGQLVSYQEEIDLTRNLLREKQEQLDLLLERRNTEFDEEQAKAEWAALNRHALIERIEFTSSTNLSIYTDEIEVDHPELADPVPVGKFVLKLNLTNPNMTAHNRTNRRGEFDHPHVREGGFCMGEVGPTLTQLLREQQVAAAVNLAIRSLGHVVPNDDYGRHINWWLDDPDAPDPTVTEE